MGEISLLTVHHQESRWSPADDPAAKQIGAGGGVASLDPSSRFSSVFKELPSQSNIVLALSTFLLKILIFGINHAVTDTSGMLWTVFHLFNSLEQNSLGICCISILYIIFHCFFFFYCDDSNFIQTKQICKTF